MEKLRLSAMRVAAVCLAGASVLALLATYAWIVQLARNGALGFWGGVLSPWTLWLAFTSVEILLGAAFALAIVLRGGRRLELVVAALYFGVTVFVAALLVVPIGDAIPQIVRSSAWALGYFFAVRFTQVFPRRIRADDLARGAGARPGAGLVRRALGLALRPPVLFAWIVGLGVPLDMAVASGLPAGPASQLLRLTWPALALGYLYVNYRRSDAEERRRLFWIVEGALIYTIGTVFIAGVSLLAADAGVSRFGIPLAAVLDPILLSALFVCLGIAIFFHGALDSGLVVQRTTVLAGAAGLASVLFLLLETVVTDLVAERLGLGGSTTAAVSGTTAALAFRPIHARVEAAVSRWADRLSATARVTTPAIVD